MPTFVHKLADVDSRAVLGRDVEIGPFCHVGPHVRIGNGCRLDSHVAIVGHTTVGERNRFWPGSVIGGEPQDRSFRAEVTCTEIGDDNDFREGVTVNGGGEKEDGITRIGNRNLLMANCHVAHNCHVFNDTILVNGVLLGGHVHVHDGAIVSGNTVVHHWSTLGTLSFVSGGCRVPNDVPPYMLAAGSDDPRVLTINVVGMKRAGIPPEAIRLVKRVHRLLYREHVAHEAIRVQLAAETEGPLPPEVENVLAFVARTAEGRQGRARENVKFQYQPPSPSIEQPFDEDGTHRRAA